VRVQRILVVDDDALVLALIGRALADYEVDMARDGEEALQLAAPGRRVDLLITDYLMQTMTGDELLGRIREWRPHLKALIITGHQTVLEREVPQWLHAEAHLAKPFTLEELRESVIQLIGPPAASNR